MNLLAICLVLDSIQIQPRLLLVFAIKNCRFPLRLNGQYCGGKPTKTMFTVGFYKKTIAN